VKAQSSNEIQNVKMSKCCFVFGFRHSLEL
jgi:hypothetical protein